MPRLSLGPGAMVAAAFIGPGTVTTASLAGADFGLGLLWAVLFSVMATIVLQELAVRCALVSDRDLAPLISDLGRDRWWGRLLPLLIVLAIGVGNSAYQSGNLVGASLGAQAALGGDPAVWVLIAAAIAAAMIWLDRYQWLERLLVMLVALMALLFLLLLIWLAPELVDLSASRLRPALPENGIAVVLALIGTTVVPYNLFLHATAARRRWQGETLDDALRDSRWESALSIALGGAVTAAIVAVAAVLLVPAQGGQVIQALVEAADVKLPGWGGAAIGVGLFAAGLTSAIAAPVSAGWAVCGAMGWSLEHRATAFRAVAFTVLITGVVFAILATRPVALIVLAQATNALLLPVVVIALLVLANQRRLLGAYCNSLVDNTLAVGVLLFVAGLAIYKFTGLIAG